MQRRRNLLSRSHPLLLLILGGLALALLGTDSRASDLTPTVPAASRGETCVEPIPVMRRDHMRFLLHQRDETVHRGIRTTRHSLKGCVECHARTDSQQRYVRIDAEGEFCDTCHSYAAVSIDCFQCHAARPARGDGRAADSGPLTLGHSAATGLARPDATVSSMQVRSDD